MPDLPLGEIRKIDRESAWGLGNNVATKRVVANSSRLKPERRRLRSGATKTDVAAEGISDALESLSRSLSLSSSLYTVGDRNKWTGS